MGVEQQAIEQPDAETVRRAVAGAAMGNAIEWFDYAVYGYLATTVGAIFFPEANPTARQLLVFAGIAIPFVDPRVLPDGGGGGRDRADPGDARDGAGLDLAPDGDPGPRPG